MNETQPSTSQCCDNYAFAANESSNILIIPIISGILRETPVQTRTRGCGDAKKRWDIANVQPIRQLSLLLLALFLSIFVGRTTAKLCYSCAGTCHNEHHCNCQMGSCEADYCFIEKRPASGHQTTPLFRIIKGCIKRPARTRLGCDYDHYTSHVQCICSGEFCNDAITLRRRNPLPVISGAGRVGGDRTLASGRSNNIQQHYYYPHLRPNVTCRNCVERRRTGGPSGPTIDCDGTCRGEWCHEKVNTGGAGCGFGPPTLPYFYRGPELLWEHGTKVCVTLSRGNGAPYKYCVCNTPMCNETPQLLHQRVTPPFPFSLFGGSGGTTTTAASLNHRSRSVIPQRTSNAKTFHILPFYECINCDLTVEQSVFTSNCKSNRCYGHFCTYATQRVFGLAAISGSGGASVGGSVNAGAPTAIIHERQGCMNVTDPRQVQLGCTHKWMYNEEEEIHCACRGNNCNGDLTTAAASRVGRPKGHTILLFVCMLFYSPLLNMRRTVTSGF